MSWQSVRWMVPFLVALSGFLAGCFKVPAKSPWDRQVKLLPLDAPVEYSQEYITFYTLMGLVRMTPLTPEDVIRRENLKEVRITVVDKPRDLGIGFAHALLMPLVQPQRVRVEGNR